MDCGGRWTKAVCMHEPPWDFPSTSDIAWIMSEPPFALAGKGQTFRTKCVGSSQTGSRATSASLVKGGGQGES